MKGKLSYSEVESSEQGLKTIFNSLNETKPNYRVTIGWQIPDCVYTHTTNTLYNLLKSFNKLHKIVSGALNYLHKTISKSPIQIKGIKIRFLLSSQQFFPEMGR